MEQFSLNHLYDASAIFIRWMADDCSAEQTYSVVRRINGVPLMQEWDGATFRPHVDKVFKRSNHFGNHFGNPLGSPFQQLLWLHPWMCKKNTYPKSEIKKCVAKNVEEKIPRYFFGSAFFHV